MNYKEHVIVEKWKDVSTEDIEIVMNFTKSIAKTKSKKSIFYMGLVFFMIFPTLITIFSKFNTDSIFMFTVTFCSYYVAWKLFFERKYYDKESEKEFNSQIEEFEIVLKYR